MDMHYCDIFSDCWRCPVVFCPYEKLDDGTDSGWSEIEDEMYEDDEDEDEEEGW